MNQKTKSIRTFALALALGAATLFPRPLKAQDDYYNPWYENDQGWTMFDWADFTDLFDQATQIDVIDNWVTDFRLFDFSDIGNRDVFDLALPDHGQNTDFDAPLGSGIALLLGMGGAYLVAKRRKEE